MVISIQSTCTVLGMEASVLLVYFRIEEDCIGWLLDIVSLKVWSQFPCHAVKL